jgi:hypothetical protein
MWEPTLALTTICFSSTLAVFALFGYAWVTLYRLWNGQVSRMSISSAYQILKLLGWLLVTVAIILSSTYILGIFLSLFVVYVSVLLS